MYETDQFQALLDKCQKSNNDFKQSIGMCRTLHNTFEDTATYVKTEVGWIFPEQRLARKRNVSGLGKGKKKNNIVNGVDISDLTRWYSDEEFKKLSAWAKK